MERAIVCCCLLFAAINCHPTMYKLNENSKLEPDLIPISSTVIPLPVYKVAYSIDVNPSAKDEKITKPSGPVTLITVHSKKKVVPTPKVKHTEYTSVKEVSKMDFDD